MRHLYTTDDDWKQGNYMMPKTAQESRLRYEACMYYMLKALTLYRAGEIKYANGIQYQLPHRVVILDDEVYLTFKQAHISLSHQGRDKVFKALEQEYFYISRDEVSWFTANYKHYLLRSRSGLRGHLQPIPNKGGHSRI